jgi:uncharacterized protein YcnI
VRRTLIVTTVVAASLVFAGLAQAHVTLHPNALPSGGYVVVNVRVPNERATTNTTKVDVQFPAGFYSVSTEAVPGWKATITYRKLAKPVAVEGGTTNQEVDQVIFTGKLPPHQFVQFPLSVAVPKLKAGSLLTFKALQTYSNGEIVRWIGPPGADTPAPQVKVTSADSPVADYPGGVSVIKHATRLTQSALTPLGGAAAAVPLLGLAGVGVRRRRRKHV